MASAALPLCANAVIPAQKATGLVRQVWCLVKLCWLSQITSLYHMCLSTAFRKICFMIFPWCFLGSSFLPFLKTHMVFPLFPSLGTSPDSRTFQLLWRAAWQLHQPILWGLGGGSLGCTDLCAFRFLRCSQTWFLLRVGSTLLPQSPSHCPATWKMWEQRVPLKDEAKPL